MFQLAESYILEHIIAPASASGMKSLQDVEKYLRVVECTATTSQNHNDAFVSFSIMDKLRCITNKICADSDAPAQDSEITPKTEDMDSEVMANW